MSVGNCFIIKIFIICNYYNCYNRHAADCVQYWSEPLITIASDFDHI